MAKFEKNLIGDFDELLQIIEKRILSGSISASLENSSNYQNNNFRCAVRVYERYSYFGQNRVSLNVTLVGNENDLFISAITSGGSQAIFFKLNTFGEEAFLNCIIKIIENY